MANPEDVERAARDAHDALRGEVISGGGYSNTWEDLPPFHRRPYFTFASWYLARVAEAVAAERERAARKIENLSEGSGHWKAFGAAAIRGEG